VKIVVINGSPKGADSITLQYVRFLESQFSQHPFKVFHVAERIKRLEKNDTEFQAIIAEIRSASAVVWSFGLWVLVVSAQLMRFIELIRERGVETAFAGKYTAAISTSIHYYDHTAHAYLRGECEDLGMNYLDGISFDINDMEDQAKRQDLLNFARSLIAAVEQKRIPSRFFPKPEPRGFSYQPSAPVGTFDHGDKNIVVITDQRSSGSNLDSMITRFTRSFAREITIIGLDEINIRGACLGCMRCGYDYRCQYQDGFADFYNTRVRTADILVFAGTINGRFLSSRWKTFFDRAFFWNHTPSLAGKQIAYLISGPLRQNHNLAQILEASVTARQNAHFVDIITDEAEDSKVIDSQLDYLAERLLLYSRVGYLKPQNFLAVGGHKIFRDNIWGRLRGIWQADHRHYRKTGYYDFPQREWLTRLRSALLIGLTKIPAFRKKFYDNLKRFPAQRYGKLVDRLASAAGQTGFNQKTERPIQKEKAFEN